MRLRALPVSCPQVRAHDRPHGLQPLHLQGLQGDRVLLVRRQLQVHARQRGLQDELGAGSGAPPVSMFISDLVKGIHYTFHCPSALDGAMLSTYTRRVSNTHSHCFCVAFTAVPFTAVPLHMCCQPKLEMHARSSRTVHEISTALLRCLLLHLHLHPHCISRYFKQDWEEEQKRKRHTQYPKYQYKIVQQYWFHSLVCTKQDWEEEQKRKLDERMRAMNKGSDDEEGADSG